MSAQPIPCEMPKVFGFKDRSVLAGINIYTKHFTAARWSKGLREIHGCSCKLALLASTLVCWQAMQGEQHVQSRRLLQLRKIMRSEANQAKMGMNPIKGFFIISGQLSNLAGRDESFRHPWYCRRYFSTSSRTQLHSGVVWRQMRRAPIWNGLPKVWSVCRSRRSCAYLSTIASLTHCR